MVALLLDENISPVVVDGLVARRSHINIQSVYVWRNGSLKGQSDHVLLQSATQDKLTLVTYDLSTIRPLVNEWRALRLSHSGVLFVDDRTIRSHDFGGLIRALEALWDREQAADWTNRIEFLRPA